MGSRSQLGLSLEDFLGESFYPYIDQVIVPRLAQLKDDGVINNAQLLSLAELVRRRGTRALDLRARSLADTSLNTANGGQVIFASLELGRGHSIGHVIKQFSAEDFDLTVATQRKVGAALASQGLRHAIPPISFTNPRRQIMVTALVEGRTVYQRLMAASEQGRIRILEQEVKNYIDLTRALNHEDVRTQLGFPRFGSSFADHFETNYARGEDELAKLFREEIANDLDGIEGVNIHGDFHPKNIISTEKSGSTSWASSYIDWARPRSNGFEEFDMYSLLARSGVSLSEEMEVAGCAADLLHGPRNPGQEASVTRYIKNAIAQDLLAARKHHQRGRSAGDERARRKNLDLARFMYSRAIARINAATPGIVSPRFLAAIEESRERVFQGDVRAIDDYESLLKTYGPGFLLSAEEPMTESVVGSLQLESPKQGIEELRLALQGDRRKRKVRKFASRALAGMLAIATVGGGAYGIHLARERQAAQEELAEEELERWNQSHRRSYRNLFDNQFDRLFERISDDSFDDSLGRSRFYTNDHLVTQVAQEFELDEGLLRRIFRANRIYAGVERSFDPDYLHARDVNLFDVILAYNSRVLHPEENFRQGAARLRSLIQEKGDVESALFEFYRPRLSSAGNWDGWEESALFEDARYDQLRLVETALLGANEHDPFTVKSVSLRRPEFDLR